MTAFRTKREKQQEQGFARDPKRAKLLGKKGGKARAKKRRLQANSSPL